jgi:hypothetical protein
VISFILLLLLIGSFSWNAGNQWAAIAASEALSKQKMFDTIEPVRSIAPSPTVAPSAVYARSSMNGAVLCCSMEPIRSILTGPAL